jgi:glycosyltransferase involved in cell wall biosynthesis
MATRILYVITKANWGGAQRYVYDLAIGARTNGYEVAVAYGSAGELADRLHTDNIETFEIAGLARDVHFGKDWTAFLSLLHILGTFKPDVVHLNGSKVGGFGSFAARYRGVRTILFTAHAWAFNEDRLWYQKTLIKFFAWLTIVFSTHTIVVSNAMKKQITQWPGVVKKIVVIPNGTRSYAFMDKLAARQQFLEMQPALSISDIQRDLWIGTVAELHPVKGLIYAIDAIGILREKYPTLRYVIVGEGELHPALALHIQKNGLQDQVFLMGHVKEAPLYGKAYDIFLLPSLSEAFGLVLLETALAGVPVVATNVGGIPEIITDTQTGMLIPPKNPTAIATALTTFLENEALREQYSTALQQRVATEFSHERFIRATFVYY